MPVHLCTLLCSLILPELCLKRLCVAEKVKGQTDELRQFSWTTSKGR